MNTRPNLDVTISLTDFKEFYWLKKELTDFCREEGLKTSGGKIDIAQRIERYLSTGKKEVSTPKVKRSKRSNFDWNTAKLTNETVITDSYKNTENVREFFQQTIGKRFKFNVQFMKWMKGNPGKTLEDAAEEWTKIELDKKKNTKPKDIAPQFEYNRYLRDFLADNPAESRDTGIQLWKIKRSIRGDNLYVKSDLGLLKGR